MIGLSSEGILSTFCPLLLDESQLGQKPLAGKSSFSALKTGTSPVVH